MSALLAIALKSLALAGLTLLLLRLLRRRSAAERSWVAHLGLVALLLLAFAPLALPRWTVEAPAVMGRADAPVAAPAQAGAVRVSPSATILPDAQAGTAVEPPPLSPAMIATALYAIPAAILLVMTLLALARLVALRARADVLVDGHWLSALARAQRRMGFKHGTALLTSDDLASPISWGLMRPVILLNPRAVDASGEAEAIIAHELAHVANVDWAKLLLSRIVVALFWFNPLVWILAREAHQLREETADDAVLAANIADTDYAQLLAGVARHDCPGLLLGAHGVAPSKGSLSRRIARVLDSATARSPANRGFAFGMIAGVAVVAAPLAALTLVPAGEPDEPAAAAKQAFAASQPADLGTLIKAGVGTSIDSALAAVGSPDEVAPAVLQSNPNIQVEGAVAESIRDARAARAIAIAGAKVAIARADPPDPADGADPEDRQDRADEQLEALALGLTPALVAEFRAASPALRRVETSDIVGLKAVGGTPAFVRDMAAAGFDRAGADDLTEARAVGVTGGYARAIRATGMRVTLDDLIELRALGINADFITSLRAEGYRISDPDQLVELWTMGLHRSAVPRSPKPPRTYQPPPLPRPGGT